jgi:hypothetical protein
MGKWLHRLTDLDRKNKTAVCSNCGPVKLRKKGTQFRCAPAVNKYRKEFRRVHGAKIPYHEPNPGICSICTNTVRVAYDHDHVSGEFRGWLCINCNTVLGLVRDSPLRLRTLADYLEKHS